MERLNMCRICLVENVRMYIVGNRNLYKLYEKLTDVPFVTEDRRPLLVCFFCFAKLKQCYKLMRNCLIANELFAQILDVNYVPNPLIDTNLLVIFGGFEKVITHNISTVNVRQIETIVIKEELPAVYEGLDDNIEPEETHQSDELELENLNNSCHDVADIPPHHSESDLEDITHNISTVNVGQIQSIAIKEELPAVSEGLDDNIEPEETHQSDELELENLNNSCHDVADIPPHHSDSDLEDELPLIMFNTQVEEEQEVSKKKRRTSQTTEVTVAKKPKLDRRKTKQDAITTEVTKKKKSNSKIIQKTKKRATVTKKSNLDTQRTKQDAITTEPTKTEKSDSKIIRKTKKRATVMKKSNLEDAITAKQTKKEQSNPKVILARATRKHTSKPGTSFKEPYKCDQSNLNGVKQSIQVYKHKCDICQRSFRVMGLLINHIRTHTGEKPFKCEVCERSFTEKGGLTKHNLVHTGEKQCKCHVCGRSLRGKDTLKKHIRIHTGEKPYKCDLCQRSFRERGHLTNHIRIHTGEKPYKCDLCQHRFTEKGNLTKHKILMHSAKTL